MYKIIRFTPKPRQNTKLIDVDSFSDDKDYIEHSYIDLALGASRIGGSFIDLPESLEHPDNMYFAAQLNLVQFSPFDPFDLLPKTGFLYFFIGEHGDIGKVFFSNVEANKLKRTIREHDRWFSEGYQVDRIFNEEEDFDSRYCEELEDLFDEEEGGIQWDFSAGSEKSKLYGIYTHCQKHEEEIREITDSNDILLLQIGEDFTSEGVWSVLIDQTFLKKKDFQNCKFEWGQS
jgi:uncharacterized protein YwqG